MLDELLEEFALILEALLKHVPTFKELLEELP